MPDTAPRWRLDDGSSGLPGCRPGLRIRCRIFPFSSLLFACWPPTYTQPIDCANRDSETLLKPLQTLAFVGVSQPHDGDTKTADATATAAPRPHPGTPRPRHDGHVQGRHDVQGTTATSRHGHSHDVTTTATTGTDMIAYKGTCPRGTTRHAKAQSHKRSNVAPCNKHPRKGASPRRKKQGRWLSSADAECSLEHFWITRYLRGLHIFSGCNRFCTLHIVYNGLWIDVDDGRA